MRSRSEKARRPRIRRGLGLIEVLLCVTISSLLLSAVAFAFRASFNSFKDAQQRGQMLNSVRGGLYQITADIRAADAAAPYDPTSSIAALENSQFNNQVVPGNPTPGLPSAGGTGVLGIQLLKTHADPRDPGASSANPVIITYWLDAPSRTVYMTRQSGSATPTPFPICRFVQSMQVYMQPLYVPPNPQARTSASIICRRVVVTLTLANKDASGDRILSDGNQELTLTFTDSAVPRKSFPGI
jgi:hypothetical protein